jgi:DNA-binding GntR family transcriptional regulator
MPHKTKRLDPVEDCVAEQHPGKAEHTPPPRRPRLLARFAAERLRDDILRGRLAPGEEIAEQDYCNKLGVSRTPVREALKVLSAEGLIALRRNRPATVAHFDRESLGHLFEIQTCLESFAARLAATRLEEAGLARLAQFQSLIEAAAAAGDLATYTRHNRALHRDIVAGAKNPELLAMHGRIIEKLALARNAALNVGRRLEESVAEHRDILAAFEARDAEAAARLVEQHNQRTADLFMTRKEA